MDDRNLFSTFLFTATRITGVGEDDVGGPRTAVTQGRGGETMAFKVMSFATT